MNTNPHTPGTEPHNQWKIGHLDRILGHPCRSANGAYLDGWYATEPNQELTKSQSIPTGYVNSNPETAPKRPTGTI